MADLVTTPQFAVPFNIGSDGMVDLVEQDSATDRFQNALAIVRYAPGERTAIPDFGVPDQALRENGADFTEVAAAIRRYEPEVSSEMVQNVITAGTQTMTIEISTDDEASDQNG